VDGERPEKKGWQYRLASLRQAFAQFQGALSIAATRELSPLEKQGLIQGFEFTHELAWNAMRDFLLENGSIGLFGSKDTTREAFRKGLIVDGESWMQMIEHRNLSSHTYKEATAEEIVESAKSTYGNLFEALIKQMEELEKREGTSV
jgi:nucleotidyltransferase substrate binding protein (TIGR01987 family)